MNITLAGTKVSMDGHTLAFQKNNLVDSMVITVDTDETWQYKLDVKYPCKDSNGKELYNVIDLTRVDNTCTAILQAPMLPFNGKYTMQLRGISDDKVYHTDTFDVWVKYSIDPGKVYDPVPSEFYQIEQAVTEQAANAKQSEIESAESAKQSAESATNAAESAAKAEDAVGHSPIVGENGNWFIWDFEKSEYVDSGKPASTPPITPDTAGKYLTNDGSKAEWGIPSGGTDISLGLTAATVGQTIKVKAVDTDGKPTEWEAVDAARDETWELIASGEMQEAAALQITTDTDGAAFTLKSAQIIVDGATSFARSTSLRFEVDNITDGKNIEMWAVEYHGDGKNDNPDIRAVYIAEQNKVPILTVESPANAIVWDTSVCKVQFAKKKTKVNGASNYSFDPLTTTISRIYIGNYMGSGTLGAGCKYQIWGIRA